VDVLEVAAGLWRWTAPHPEWAPGEDWPEEVGCVYWDGGGAVCLVDPLVPRGEEERFLRHLDADVERAGTPVAVVLATADHERSAEELRGRYGAEVLAWHAERERLSVPVDRVFTSGETLPGGLEAIDAARPEALLWLPARATLLAADVLVGGPLRVSPWDADADERRRTLAALRALRELPVETVVVSHGEPAVEGREALLRALDDAGA
jgi:glyoxylase-like metal-dependent hydrolase (beta-lactamase superfamily II)